MKRHDDPEIPKTEEVLRNHTFSLSPSRWAEPEENFMENT
jgi:hypothetical protein